MKKNHIRGQALVPILISAVMVGIMALAVPDMLTYLRKQQRTLRVKNQMKEVEGRIRLRLNNRNQFGCNSAVDDCTLEKNWHLFEDSIGLITGKIVGIIPSDKDTRTYRPQVLGSECPTAIPACRIDVDIDDSTRTVTITYQGIEVKIKPVTFTYKVPLSGNLGDVACMGFGEKKDRNGVFAGYTINAAGVKAPTCLEPKTFCPAGQIFILDKVSGGLGGCKEIYKTLVNCADDEKIIGSILQYDENLKPVGVECMPKRFAPDRSGLTK